MNLSDYKFIKVAGINMKSLELDGVEIWRWAYKNWVSFSINADGTIYNNGLGYKQGYRVRSGGQEGAANYATCTGYIPVKAGDVVRLSGYDVKYTSNSNVINVSDASFTNLGQISANSSWSSGCFKGNSYNWNAVILEKTGVYYWIVPDGHNIAYIRVTGYGATIGDDMIITVNEEII